MIVEIKTLSGLTKSFDTKVCGVSYCELPKKKWMIQEPANNVVFNHPVSEEQFNKFMDARKPKKTTKK